MVIVVDWGDPCSNPSLGTQLLGQPFFLKLSRTPWRKDGLKLSSQCGTVISMLNLEIGDQLVNSDPQSTLEVERTHILLLDERVGSLSQNCLPDAAAATSFLLRDLSLNSAPVQL